MKDKLMFAFLILSSLAFADCTISPENITLIPSSPMNLEINQNASMTYISYTVLYGNCDASGFFFSGCDWCMYSRENWTQAHGSNIPTSVIISVPSLPTNSTNQTYSFNITLNATNMNMVINSTFNNETNTTEYLFYDLPRMILNVFVPFNETNITQTIQNTTISANMTMEEFVGALTREDMLRLALYLDQNFRGYNWSFISKVYEERRIEVPVIQAIPMNLEEYQRWQKNCNPMLYEECQNTVNALKKDNEEFTGLAKSWQSQYTTEHNNCMNDCQTKLDNVTSTLTTQRDSAETWLIMTAVAFIFIIAFLTWHFRGIDIKRASIPSKIELPNTAKILDDIKNKLNFREKGVSR